MFFQFFFIALLTVFCSLKTEKPEFGEHRNLYHALKTQKEKRGKVVLSRDGSELFLKGKVEEEWFGIRNGYTLDNRFPDWLSKVRQRVDICFHSHIMSAQSKKPVVEAAFHLLNMHFWRELYSNLYLQAEPVILDVNEQTGHILQGGKSLEQVFQTFTNPTISSPIPIVSFTQAFIKLHLDSLISGLEKAPHILMAGYFPYQLGRGIALGPSDEGGITFLGYDFPLSPLASPYYAPGILLRGKTCRFFSYELYYSVWKRQYTQPFERDAIDFRFRLDKDKINRFGKQLKRDIWSLKGIIEHEGKHHHLSAQPYFLWMDSTFHRADPAQKLTDRATRLGTYGCMIEWHTPSVSFNIEAAGQCGHIRFYPFDRNELVLDRDASGRSPQTFTHVKKAKMNISNTGEISFSKTEEKMPAADALIAIINSKDALCTSFETPIADADGNTTVDLSTGQYIDFEELKAVTAALSNEGTAAAQVAIEEIKERYVQAFNAQTRVRNGYKTALRGYTILADGIWHVSHRLDLMAGGGIISGGQNPYKCEKDNRYNGFLPLRDIKYQGWAIRSLALLGARSIPRPADGNIHRLDCSNLALVGIGSLFSPLKKKEKCTIQAHVIYFMQPSYQTVSTLQKPVSCQTASKDLGWELNATLLYKPIRECTVTMRGALFFPGQLYKEREGQQVEYFTIKGNSTLVPIGTDTAWGINIGISYQF